MAESKRRATIRETAGEMKERFAANPFLDEMQLVVRTKKFARQVLGLTINDEETNLPKPVFYHGQRNIDTEVFTKVFAEGWERVVFLSRAGLLVLKFVSEQLLPGNSVVWLDRDEFVSLKHARHTYYTGMDEMITLGFLARTQQRGFYFINPAFIFNGNRISMRHDFTKPKKSA